MAHDLNGEELHCGDVVYLPCTVVGIDRHDEYVNCMLETQETVYPSNERVKNILVNSKQCVLVSKAVVPVEEKKAISIPEIDSGILKKGRK